MEYRGVDYADFSRVKDRRFVPPELRKTWQVSKVWDLHHEIKRRILLGEKNTRIAEAVGCSSQTVSNVRNSAVIQDQLAIMRGARDAYTVDIAREIQEFAPKALDLLKKVVDGDGAGANASISLRAKEANNFLDRAGHSPIRRTDVRGLHAVLTKDDIEEIKQRARGSNGPIVDAEFVDES